MMDLSGLSARTAFSIAKKLKEAGYTAFFAGGCVRDSLMKKTPEDKHLGYFVVSLLVMIVVYYVVELILRWILLSSMGLSYYGRGWY